MLDQLNTEAALVGWTATIELTKLRVKLLLWLLSVAVWSCIVCIIRVESLYFSSTR